VDEARIVDTEAGRVAAGSGWFVLNLREAAWKRKPEPGTWCAFEPDDAEFEQFGVNVHVVQPGQASARYHAESVQEDFLVLAGECVAIVEGVERPMRQWDFLHCPAGTNHVLVGAGDGPCAILMIGARSPDATVHYPVSELAARYGASAPHDTDSPKEAYADHTGVTEPAPSPWSAI
jgi:uncharacterized cupin superfamily protein